MSDQGAARPDWVHQDAPPAPGLSWAGTGATGDAPTVAAGERERSRRAMRNGTLPVVSGGVAAVLAMALLIPPVRDAVNANAGVVLAVGVAALALVGAVALRLARSMEATTAATGATATATARLAEATMGLATASREQRLDAVRPVVVCSLRAGGHVLTFGLRVANSGVGPALDLRLELEGSPLRLAFRDLTQPLALAAGGEIETIVALSEERPFAAEGHPLRWPRDAEEAALVAAADRPARHDRGGAILDPTEHLATLQRIQDRYRDFRRDVVVEIARNVRSAGTLTARYRDIHGRRFVTTVPVVVAPADDEDQPARVVLGATAISVVSTISAGDEAASDPSL